MTPEEMEIARAFVACKDWRWLPGMLLRDLTRSKKGRVHKVGNDWVVYFGINSESRYRCETVGYSVVPDITDPATLGCILQVVRDATGDPDLHVRCIHPYTPSYTAASPYAVYSGRGQRLTERHNSEAATLLQVLQAAPQYIQEI